MRAVLCNGFHGIEALSIGEAAEPRPGADEVLIDVHAASVSFADHLMICGGYQNGQPSLTYREWTLPGLSSPAAKTFSDFVPVIGSPARLGSVVLRSA